MIGHHSVGEVVYIISRKEHRVYPVLVVEELVRKTLEGTATSYIVRLPDKKATQVPLESIADRAFADHDELRHHLISTASKTINTLVDDAVSIGRSLAPAGAEPPMQSEEEDAGDVTYVTLPDGTRARLKS